MRKSPGTGQSGSSAPPFDRFVPELKDRLIERRPPGSWGASALTIVVRLKTIGTRVAPKDGFASLAMTSQSRGSGPDSSV